MRPKKWNDPGRIGFRTEQYLIDAFLAEMKKDGFSDLTDYFNVIMLKIIGEENDGFKKFVSDHEEYESKVKN